MSFLKIQLILPAGAVECTACEKHKHAAPGSELCSECKGKTFEDVNDKDVPDLGDGEQLWKCFRKDLDYFLDEICDMKYLIVIGLIDFKSKLHDSSVIQNLQPWLIELFLV